MTSAHATLRLLQLASPALPVGAYNFSQGLEYAAERGWVGGEIRTGDWILGVARQSLRTLDLPVLARLHTAWTAGDGGGVLRWNAFLIASRETSELRAEERHMGRSLAKILSTHGVQDALPWLTRDVAYATMHALAAARYGISSRDGALGFLWGWAENQVLAAQKLLPLGQSAGQRMLNRLLDEMPAICEQALALGEDDLGVATPGHAIACAHHETQYSRLFRS
jgi:urease accessory protein